MMLLKYTSVWVTITFPEMKFNNLLSTELQSNIQCIHNKSGCSADEGENIDFVFFQIHFNYFSLYYCEHWSNKHTLYTTYIFELLACAYYCRKLFFSHLYV